MSASFIGIIRENLSVFGGINHCKNVDLGGDRGANPWMQISDTASLSLTANLRVGVSLQT